MELDQPIIEAIHETKPIEDVDEIEKLNNTIDNLQTSINAHCFNQLPVIESKEDHELIKRTTSDPTNTSQIEDAESQEEVYSTTISSPKKKGVLYMIMILIAN